MRTKPLVVKAVRDISAIHAGGNVTVPAYLLFPGLAVHHTVGFDGVMLGKNDWTITHTHSGLQLDSGFTSYRQVKRACNLISEARPWTKSKEYFADYYGSGKYEVIRAILQAVKEDKTDGEIAILIFEKEGGDK